jgi:TatA/E family protein of Tat protein translocase
MNLGVPEMIFLAVLGLLIFGPRKLPEIGRQLGKAMGEFKRASQEFQSQLNEEVRQLELEPDLKDSIAGPTGTSPRPRVSADSGSAEPVSHDDSLPTPAGDSPTHG